jgi:hypothetical protein
MRLESFLASPESWERKFLVPGAGDGAQVRDQILLVHADAGVGDGEGLLLLVELQIDARIEGKALVRIVDQRQVAQLVERVGGVGNELAQKDLRMGVEGVDDQLQQLADFGLKFTFRHIARTSSPRRSAAIACARASIRRQELKEDCRVRLREQDRKQATSSSISSMRRLLPRARSTPPPSLRQLGPCH